MRRECLRLPARLLNRLLVERRADTRIQGIEARASTSSNTPRVIQLTGEGVAGSKVSHVSLSLGKSVEPDGGAPAPPNSTYRFRVESNASPAAIRGGGPMSWRWVQCWPFHCQVAPNGTIGLDVAMPPPNCNTVCPSHSADAAMAAGGPKCATSVQAAPSHVQVSASSADAGGALRPPKTSTRWAATSKVMAWVYRASGPLSATCVHSMPSHAQVSSSTGLVLSAPPNRTTCSRTASYASAFSARALGPVSATCVHSAPSHSQVSIAPVMGVPPNSTTRSRMASKAIAPPPRADGPMSETCVQSAPSHTHVSAVLTPPAT